MHWSSLQNLQQTSYLPGYKRIGLCTILDMSISAKIAAAWRRPTYLLRLLASGQALILASLLAGRCVARQRLHIVVGDFPLL